MARGSTTDFQHVAACLQRILVFDFCERGTSEREIKSKIQAAFRREAEASSSLKRNKWGQPVGATFMPDLSLNSLEWSASSRGDGGEKRMAIRRRQGCVGREGDY
jgi:hypothetical protein